MARGAPTFAALTTTCPLGPVPGLVTTLAPSPGCQDDQLHGPPRLAKSHPRLRCCARRDRIRAKVNFFACIRTDAFGDDVVHCIDMSRGGLSFKTEYRYQVGAVLRIAVPFSPESREAPAIFVPAKVVYTNEIPLQEMFRCGVAYLPNR